eukprot:3863377-Rhodomonas_salina.12
MSKTPTALWSRAHEASCPHRSSARWPLHRPDLPSPESRHALLLAETTRPCCSRTPAGPALRRQPTQPTARVLAGKCRRGAAEVLSTLPFPCARLRAAVVEPASAEEVTTKTNCMTKMA